MCVTLPQSSAAGCLPALFILQVLPQQFIAASKRFPLNATSSSKTAAPFPTGCLRQMTMPLQRNCTMRAVVPPLRGKCILNYLLILGGI